jgi:hypothetical protein
VFIFVTSSIGFRTAFLPRWLAFVGFAVGLMLLMVFTDFAWIALLFPLWVFLVSVYILVADLPPRNSCIEGVTMPFAGPIDAVPLWGLFAVTVVVILLAIEAGYRLGQYRHRSAVDEREAPVGAIVGATLGLLGFILAFTFGMAAARHDARRQIVVEEANSIGTTYLRAGLLPDGRGAKIRKLLTEYVDVRLEGVQSGNVEKVLRRSDELHRDLWKEAEAVGKEHPNSIVVGLFIQSLNETIDIHAKRNFVALQNRLPGVLWATLFLVTILTMAGVGYYGALTSSRRSLALAVLVLAFSAIMTLVADLDRPQEGFLTVSQQAMIDLRTMMNDAR